MSGYDADVAVVGVGTMGSMACWQLAARGASVVGFEQFAPGHDRAGAGGESRLFRTAYLEGEQYVPMLLRAQRLWRQLEAESGHHLLELCGGLMIGDPDGELVRNVLHSVRAHDLPHQLLDHDRATARFPQHRLRDGEVMVLDEQSGYLRPEIAVTAAAEQARRDGARIETHTSVVGLEADDAGVTVRTDERAWRVRDVVVTAGAWSARLLPQATPDLTVQRLVMTWFAARDPAEFTNDRFPIFIRNTAGHDISGWPTLDNASVKVAVNYGYDEVADPTHLERDVEDRLTRTIRDAVADFLPGLVPEPVRIGAYMDGYTSDHHAVVGRPAGMPHTVVGCGFSGHGFKMSPVIGEALADLVLDGGTDLPVAHLAPGRDGLTERPRDLRRVVDDLVATC